MSGEAIQGETEGRWQHRLQVQAQRLHQQIGAMQRLVADGGGTPPQLEEACRPYYRLLDQLYNDDMPVARALDSSDLLLHLKGEGLDQRNPSLALVSGILGDVRKQVGSVIKTLVGAIDERLELPREIDLALSSFARGSLYLGFALGGPGPQYAELPGDPLLAASRQALVTLGEVASQLDAADGYEAIRREFADPKLRDCALSAVGQLAPTGRRGVTSIAIGGRAFPPDRAWRTLTPQTRLQIRSWLEKPVLSPEILSFTGRVRSIDLDLRRFDLRRVEGRLPDLRCIYPASFDAAAKGWLDTDVIAEGRVESYQGNARLLQLADLKPAPRASA
jgi:hypothetical protein